MSNTFAEIAVNAATDAVASLLDGGSLSIMSGVRPRRAGGKPASDSLVLVVLVLPSPAFRKAEQGVATSKAIQAARATATGFATWYRVTSKSGRTIFDGDVGAIGSHSDLTLSALQIQIGAEIVITELRYTSPME